MSSVTKTSCFTHEHTKPKTMCQTKNFYLWLLQVVFFSALIVILLWLSLRPKAPRYTIIQFNVPVSNSSFSSSSVVNGTANNQSSTTTTISFSLEIKNPNKDSNIYYDHINITVSYGKKVIGGIVIPSFYQKRRTTNQFDKNLSVDEKLLKKVAAAISNGKAEFEIGLVTKIKYKTVGVKSRHHGMELEGHVNVDSDGMISGKKKKVKLHRKWKLGRFLKN